LAEAGQAEGHLRAKRSGGPPQPFGGGWSGKTDRECKSSDAWSHVAILRTPCLMEGYALDC